MKKSFKTALGLALLTPTLLLCGSCSEEYGTTGSTKQMTCTLENPGLKVETDKNIFQAKNGTLDYFTVTITANPLPDCHDFNIESMKVIVYQRNIKDFEYQLSPDAMGKCQITVTESITPIDQFYLGVYISEIKGTYIKDLPAQEDGKDVLLEAIAPTDYWVRDNYGYYTINPKEKTANFAADKGSIDAMKWFGIGQRYTENLYVPDYATCKNGSKIKTVVGNSDYDYGFDIYKNVETLMLDGTFSVRQVSRFLGNGSDKYFPSLRTLYIKELTFTSSQGDITANYRTKLSDNVTVYIEYQDPQCDGYFGNAKVVTGNDVNFKITKAMKENKTSLLIYVTPITIIVDVLILGVAFWIISSIISGIKKGSQKAKTKGAK